MSLCPTSPHLAIILGGSYNQSDSMYELYRPLALSCSSTFTLRRGCTCKVTIQLIPSFYFYSQTPSPTSPLLEAIAKKFVELVPGMDVHTAKLSYAGLTIDMNLESVVGELDRNYFPPSLFSSNADESHAREILRASGTTTAGSTDLPSLEHMLQAQSTRLSALALRLFLFDRQETFACIERLLRLKIEDPTHPLVEILDRVLVSTYLPQTVL